MVYANISQSQRFSAPLTANLSSGSILISLPLCCGPH